jgi:hypothetical protein
LARDKLGASISGASLIAPAVRTAFEALMSEVGRKTVKPLLTSLQPEEVELLVELLTGQIQRDPSESEGYSAFIECAKTLPSALNGMLDACSRISLRQLPGYLPAKLQLLAKTPGYAGVAAIEAFLRKLAEDKESRAGKAANYQPKK